MAKEKKVKVRGTGCYDPETQKFGFTPFNEAPSTQRDVKNCPAARGAASAGQRQALTRRR